MNNTYKNQKANRLVPLFIILFGYSIYIIMYYWYYPTMKDSLFFCKLSSDTFKHTAFFERYTFFYIGHIIGIFFDNGLIACKYLSYFYHIVTLIIAYSIVYRISNHFQALFAICVTASTPHFTFFSTEYLSDSLCLMLGLCALLCSIITNNNKIIFLNFFLSGLFLLGSVTTKIFGICFILPVLINLWTYRTKINILWFICGSLNILLFIVVFDYIVINDLFYHLNISNYLNYYDYVSEKIKGVFSFNNIFRISYLTGGKKALVLFISSIIIIIFRFIYNYINCKNIVFNIHNFTILLTGISLMIFITRNSDTVILGHYSYVILIPAILCFSSLIPTNYYNDIFININIKLMKERELIFISLGFVISLFVMQTIINNYVLTTNQVLSLFYNLLFLIPVFLFILFSIQIKYINLFINTKIKILFLSSSLLMILIHSSAWPVFYANSGYIQTNQRRSIASNFFNLFNEVYNGGKLVLYTNDVRDYDTIIIYPLQLIGNINDSDIIYITNYKELISYANTLNSTFYIISDIDLKHQLIFNKNISTINGNSYKGMSIYMYNFATKSI